MGTTSRIRCDCWGCLRVSRGLKKINFDPSKRQSDLLHPIRRAYLLAPGSTWETYPQSSVHLGKGCFVIADGR